MFDRVINRINASVAAATSSTTDARVLVVVAFVFVATVISMPVTDPSRLLWLFCYPIIAAERCGMGYFRLFLRSLWVLPLVLVVGVFNPVFDTQPVWQIGTVTVTRGWLTFLSLTLRGVLAFQGLLLLVWQCGFYDICRCLRTLGLPGVLVTQLLLLYRYIGVLLAEAQSIQRAALSRGYGKRSFPLRMWSIMIGQLLVRSIERARRVDAAMNARCFSGVFYFRPFATCPRFADYFFLVGWIAVFAVIRFVNLSSLISGIFIP